MRRTNPQNSNAQGSDVRSPSECAENCISAVNPGSCSAGDEQCLCSSSAFVDAVRFCVTMSCPDTELAAAAQALEAVCARVVRAPSAPHRRVPLRRGR